MKWMHGTLGSSWPPLPCDAAQKGPSVVIRSAPRVQSRGVVLPKTGTHRNPETSIAAARHVGPAGQCTCSTQPPPLRRPARICST